MKQLTADELREMYLSFFESKGHVRISGTDIARVNTANLRALEGFVTQETHLFQGTIRDNLRIVRKCPFRSFRSVRRFFMANGWLVRIVKALVLCVVVMAALVFMLVVMVVHGLGLLHAVHLHIRFHRDRRPFLLRHAASLLS